MKQEKQKKLEEKERRKTNYSQKEWFFKNIRFFKNQVQIKINLFE